MSCNSHPLPEPTPLFLQLKPSPFPKTVKHPGLIRMNGTLVWNGQTGERTGALAPLLWQNESLMPQHRIGRGGAPDSAAVLSRRISGR